MIDINHVFYLRRQKPLTGSDIDLHSVISPVIWRQASSSERGLTPEKVNNRQCSDYQYSVFNVELDSLLRCLRISRAESAIIMTAPASIRVSFNTRRPAPDK